MPQQSLQPSSAGTFSCLMQSTSPMAPALHAEPQTSHQLTHAELSPSHEPFSSRAPALSHRAPTSALAHGEALSHSHQGSSSITQICCPLNHSSPTQDINNSPMPRATPSTQGTSHPPSLPPPSSLHPDRDSNLPPTCDASTNLQKPRGEPLL